MNRTVLSLILYMICSLAIHAQVTARRYIFVTEGNICEPIQINAYNKDYHLYSGGNVSIQLYSDSWSAYDCNGKRINTTQWNREVDNETNTVFVTFTGTPLKKEDTTTYSEYEMEETSSTSSSGNILHDVAANATQKGLDTYSNAYEKGLNTPHEDFPYWGISAGYSRFASPFVELKYRTGGWSGIVLMAQYGFDKSPDNKVLWNVGLGVCLGHLNINIRYGETYLSINQGISTDIAYDWFFSKRIGVSIFGGSAACDIKKNKPDYTFNWGIALICRL